MSNFQFEVEYIDSGCNREAMLTTADSFYENKQNGKLTSLKILKIKSKYFKPTKEFFQLSPFSNFSRGHKLRNSVLKCILRAAEQKFSLAFIFQFCSSFPLID